MAQYDLILTQNTHATLTEFTERVVNLAKEGRSRPPRVGFPPYWPQEPTATSWCGMMQKPLV